MSVPVLINSRLDTGLSSGCGTQITREDAKRCTDSSGLIRVLRLQRNLNQVVEKESFFALELIRDSPC
jgi:hypothetical protein